jgi:hypothetical protein
MKTLTRDLVDLTDDSDAPVARRSWIDSPSTCAKVAGAMYLLLAATAFFAVYVNSQIIESGDAAATANNMRDSTTLFRYGFVADILQATFFLLTAMAFYLLFRHVNQLVAAAMVVIVAVSVSIQSLNMLNQYTALTIATGKGYTETLGQAGSDGLAMLFADMQENGVLIAQMFFGLWLIPLGYLVFKSGYFPKVFGILLTMGCAMYLIELFAHFLAPGFADDTKPFTGTLQALSEMPFLLWLLVKGVHDPHVPRREPENHTTR